MRRFCIVFVRHDKLSDVERLLHHLEGFLDTIMCKERHRERTEVAVLEVFEHFNEELAGKRRTVDQHLVDVDAEVGKIAAERTKEHRRVGIEVALAEFEESTEGRKQTKRLFRSRTGRGVQHQIDAAAVRVTTNFVSKRERTRVVDMLHAQATQESTLRFRTSRCIQKVGNLNGSQTGTAGGAMNQDRFAAACSAKIRNRIPRGEEDDRDRGCLGKVQAGRHLGHSFGFRRNDGAETCRSKAHNGITGHHVRHIRADCRHDTGSFQAHGRTGEAVLERFFRQKTHRPHNVAEVETGRLDGDANLISPKLSIVGNRHVLPIQIVEPARHVECQNLGRTRRGITGVPHFLRHSL